MRATKRRALLIAIPLLGLVFAACGMPLDNTGEALLTEHIVKHTVTSIGNNERNACADAERRASLTCRKEFRYKCSGKDVRCFISKEEANLIDQRITEDGSFSCTVEVVLSGALSTAD